MKERSILHFLKMMASSWNWFAPECRRELLDLLQNDRKSLIPGSKYEVLWHTRSKFVLLLELPDGRKVVYKAPLRIKNFYKYMLRLSPYGKEARNFRLLSKLNLPLVKLLAVGEDRSFFKLQSGFLVTEYADGYSNGRDFIPQVNKIADKALIAEFVHRNLALLGSMHAAGFVHRGFTPANLLYRLSDGGSDLSNQLELRWIDLASCMKLTCFNNRKKMMYRDLALFFHYFEFSGSELQDFLQSYLQNNPVIARDSAELLKKVRANPVR